MSRYDPAVHTETTRGSDALDAPTWARALLAIDRAAHAALRAEAALRDELLCALLDERARARLTASIYAREGTYRAHSRLDREGLTPWEREAVAHPCVPRTGRVLVAGCGGGRELAALRAMGYSVVGFDPCGPLVDDARARGVAERVEVARLEDLRDASEALGPLAFLRGLRVDLALFGWTALSYVPERSARLDALRATRALAPDAPLLLSAWGPRGAEGRPRRLIRRALAALGRAAPEGMTFRPWTGFITALDAASLASLAGEAGYAVALAGGAGDPWALLTP